MNIRKILCLAAMLITATSITAGAKTLEFKIGDHSMYESDNAVSEFQLENAPYIKNERTMVPVRIISERFGAEVGWDGEKAEVSIKKDDKTIILTLGSNTAYVNGEAVTLDIAPEEFNGRTMIPIRFVSETLEMDVKYVNSTRQIIISDNEALLTVAGIDITIDNYKSFIIENGFIPGISDAVGYIQNATEAFKMVYGAASKILLEGDYALGSDSESVNTAIKNSMYTLEINQALSSPLAEYMDYQNVVIEKAVNETTTSVSIDTPYEEMTSIAEELCLSYLWEGKDGVEIIVHKTDEEIAAMFE